MKRQLLALIIVLCMAIVFTACCGSPTPTPEPPTPMVQTFTYVYNDATENNSVNSVELKTETLCTTQLVVPIREDFNFKGWYADWLFNTKVSDEQGNLVIGNDVFDINSTQLFAKWLHKDYATYEILMVYVTEFSATLERYKDAPHPPIVVDYKMTDTEMQVFKLISPMLEQYLNALLNGLVVFEVDTYFTTEPLGRNNVIAGGGSWRDTDGTLFYDYGMEAWNIPEIGGVAWEDGTYNPSQIGGMLSNYRTVFTTWGMNDWTGLLHQSAASAGNKYGQVHIESLFAGLSQQNISLENLLDPTWESYWNWWHTSIMPLYLHEFTHTVELQLENREKNGIYGLHRLIQYFGDLHGSIRSWDIGIRENAYGVSQVDGVPYMTEIEIMRLFLLDQINIDERTIGIPFTFWKS